MKNILFILVIALFLKPILPVVDYVINYEYISKVLCENKDKPKLNCNGKCHLAKQFAKQDKQEKSTSETQKFKVETLEITAQIPTTIAFIYPIKSVESANYYAFSEARSDAHLMEIFHPPTV